jgi:general secretion pathway protein E
VRINCGATPGQLRAAAVRNGTRFLREAAIDLVRSGQTTLQEINRVTFVA